MPPFKPRNSEYAARVRGIFEDARFIRLLGVELEDCRPGFAETSLVIRPDLLQQDDLVHAGVQATMADHTAGAAAATLMAADQIVLQELFRRGIADELLEVARRVRKQGGPGLGGGVRQSSGQLSAYVRRLAPPLPPALRHGPLHQSLGL